MVIDPSVLAGRKAHDLLISAVIPRPIAWVCSIDAQGAVDLAPFSMFSLITWDPPTLSFSVVNRPDGSPKRTLLNIRATGSFVVNIVSEDLAGRMAATSAAVTGGLGKAEAAGIELAPSSIAAAPRVSQAKVAFECALDRIVTVGSGPNAGNLILGGIKALVINDDVLAADGTVDGRKLKAVARLGGAEYCAIQSVFEIVT